jgi:tetratricopeptide (TPR) repeat protein
MAAEIVYLYRGNAFLRQGDLEHAENDLKKAIEYAPSLPDPYLNLGNVYAELEEFDLAIQYYTLANSLYPDQEYAKAYNNLGTVYLDLGDEQAALDHFKKAVEFDPNNIPSYYNLGQIYLRREDYQSAIDNLTQAIDGGLNLPEAYLFRGNAYYETRNYQLAVDDFTEVICLRGHLKSQVGARSRAKRRTMMRTIAA